MNSDGETRTFKVKFLHVCDDPLWDPEQVARALEGDTKFVAPTIRQATTHLTTAQAVQVVDPAIHPKLQVYFDASKRVFRVCMPILKTFGLSSRRKKEARSGPAGPAPPRAPPPARPETQWRFVRRRPKRPCDLGAEQ